MFIRLQTLLPAKCLSVLCGMLARVTWAPVKNRLLRWFVAFYQIDLTEAESDELNDYPHFNAFFTRRLKAGARNLTHHRHRIIAPVDGVLSEFGTIADGRLLQAKRHAYSLYELLGGCIEDAELFYGGCYLTCYLAPSDYHRVHMPLTGQLHKMRYIPGRLLSVNAATCRTLPKLYARNERVVCLFDSEWGPYAMVLVGAMLVGGIHINWHGDVTPPHGKEIRHWHYPNVKTPVKTLRQGSEMGYFHYGSTVLVIFPPRLLTLADHLQRGQRLRLGEVLGRVRQD